MRRLLGQLLLLVAAHGELVVPPDAAAAPVEKAATATACGIQYTSVSDAWRATSNTCCADQYGRCLGQPTIKQRGGWGCLSPWGSRRCWDTHRLLLAIVLA